jgi:hypothetical protein
MLGRPGGFHSGKLKVERYSNSIRDLVLKREQIVAA